MGPPPRNEAAGNRSFGTVACVPRRSPAHGCGLWDSGNGYSRNSPPFPSPPAPGRPLTCVVSATRFLHAHRPHRILDPALPQGVGGTARHRTAQPAAGSRQHSPRHTGRRKKKRRNGEPGTERRGRQQERSESSAQSRRHYGSGGGAGPLPEAGAGRAGPPPEAEGGGPAGRWRAPPPAGPRRWRRPCWI